jgi:hypothetical protein
MKLKNGMKVIAPSGCESYLTEGKEYEVFNVEILSNPSCEFKFEFIADNGGQEYSVLKGSSHLNGKDWIIKEEKPSTSVNIKYEFELLIEVLTATDNLYAKKKVKRIYNQLKKLAKDSPNDLTLGSEIRKTLN